MQMVQPLHAKITKRIGGRINLNVSLAGRSCHIQSVTNTMANFLMSCFVLPKKTIKENNLSQAKYWWGKIETSFVDRSVGRKFALQKIKMVLV